MAAFYRSGRPATTRLPPPPVAQPAPPADSPRGHRQARLLHRRLARNSVGKDLASYRSRTWRLLRDHQLLAGLNFVRIGEAVAIGLEDLHVFIRVAVKLFADFRERIAGL